MSDTTQINHADLLEAYRQSGTARGTADKLGISYETVRKMLKSQGVELRRGRPKTKGFPLSQAGKA